MSTPTCCINDCNTISTHIINDEYAFCEDHYLILFLGKKDGDFINWVAKAVR